MADQGLDVAGIGNAIVDVLAHTPDEFLIREGLVKGTMRLIDADQAEALYARMGPGVECSGGSAARRATRSFAAPTYAWFASTTPTN